MNSEDIYEIFNNIQTGSNTVDNQSKLVNFFEKEKNKDNFITHLEMVFLIILKNFEKSNMALKNIGDFIADFIQKVVKMPKIKEANKKLLNHFCQLFTFSTKKPKIRNLCIYFLGKFA
jgi:6-pyruvoyl-tetrahydropterin synthase